MKQGIYPGLGMPEYHGWKLDKANLADGPISASMLKRFAENPFAWLKSPEITQTPAMRLGSILDAALTDPKELDALLPEAPEALGNVAILPFSDLRSNAAKAWKAEQEAAGKVVMKEAEYEAAQVAFEESLNKRDTIKNDALHAADAVRNHAVAGKILDGCQFQVGVIGAVGKIPAKCLLDILPSEDSDECETIWDYKTTGNGISDAAIRKTIGQFKLHWQAAFYKTLFNKVSTDRHIEDFGFVFQCTKTHEVRCVKLGTDAMDSGRRAVGAALKQYAHCAYKGIHSRYLNTCDELELLPYHAMDEEEWISNEEGGTQ